MSTLGIDTGGMFIDMVDLDEEEKFYLNKAFTTDPGVRGRNQKRPRTVESG